MKKNSQSKEYYRQYYLKNKEKKIKQTTEYNKKYYKTQMGRAVHLVNTYKMGDKINNRGECTLTAKWVVENIFNKPCVHCGKTGWDVIGCNRLNNKLPHTPDNVEPCCFDCNRKQKKKNGE